MPESAATKNTPPSTTSADEQGEVTKPTFQHAPISPSTATTNSNPVPNAESSTSPSPPSKKDFDNKKRTIKIPSVFIAIFATPLHFFHPTKSPIILSHPIFLITPYIFISLGFNISQDFQPCFIHLCAINYLLALCLFLVYHIHSFCCRPRASTLSHVPAWGFPFQLRPNLVPAIPDGLFYLG